MRKITTVGASGLLGVLLWVAWSPLFVVAQEPSCTAAYYSWPPNAVKKLWSDDPVSLERWPQANIAHLFSDPVPEGSVLLLRGSSISVREYIYGEYMLERLSDRDEGYQYEALAREWAAGTPVLAWQPSTVASSLLRPGERLIARNATGAAMKLLYSGYLYPASCEATLLNP